MTTSTKKSPHYPNAIVFRYTSEIPVNFTGVCYITCIGFTEWFVNGKFHRIGKPARISDNGTEEWWHNDKFHRSDGPACTYADGTKEWWVNDQIHRLEGPAIEYSDGTKEYWIHDKLIGEEPAFNLLVNMMKIKGLT